MYKKIETLEELEEILSSRIKDIPINKIPHYRELEGTIEGANLIKEEIEKNSFITVIGDYDVDGIVSSAIMSKFFKDIGYENYEIVIPDRFKEGYGISPKIIERINKKTSLVITVDNGITGFQAFEILKEMGIKAILTDHHTPKMDENTGKLIPDADIVINPKVSFNYDMKEICGAQVAWYLLAALKNEAGFNINLVDYLDYLTLAIIADIMPLVDLNRALVIYGLKKMKAAEKPFSKVLVEEFKDINSGIIGFQIAPRLNAAGRIAKADIALRFLLASTYEEARRSFVELTYLNETRKKIQDEVHQNVEPIVYDRFVFVVGEFHPGVAGIVASKLVQEYKKPCIVFHREEGVLKGSGRSLGNINLFEIINPLKDLYLTFGGHPSACGISLKEENFEEFAKTVDERSKALFSEEDYFIDENIVGEIDFDLITDKMLEILEKFEPYGFGNPVPVFIAKNVKVIEKEILREKFTKLLIQKENRVLSSMVFSLEDINPGENIKEIMFSVSRNMHNNPSLIVKEIVKG